MLAKRREARIPSVKPTPVLRTGRGLPRGSRGDILAILGGSGALSRQVRQINQPIDQMTRPVASTLSLFASAVLALLPFHAEAQAAERVYRVAVVSPSAGS